LVMCPAWQDLSELMQDLLAATSRPNVPIICSTWKPATEPKEGCRVARRHQA
jgi:hypothetical protein